MGTLKSRVLQPITAGAVIGTVMDVGFGTIGTTVDSKKQGDSAPVTVAKVATDALAGAFLGPVASAVYFGATIGYDMMMQTAKQNGELQKKMKYTGSGRVGSGYFNMSGAGYTMRQRAMSQIRSNGQNVNSVLGNEARNYIKSSQNY